MRRVVLIGSSLAIIGLAIIWSLFSPLGPPEGLCYADNWCWQNPLPQGNTFHSVCFIDQNHGWAVGDHGTIFYTTDGQEWSPQDSDIDEELYDVTFTDFSNGWAVGFSWRTPGTILHTTDCGITWSKQDSGATGSEGCLYAVTFTDPTNGWAVGRSWHNKGRILHTTNGGQDWSLQYSGNERTTLHDVTFIDSQTGWAVGYGCTILHTTNGGDTWVQVNKHLINNPENLDLESINLYALTFIDADNGWAMGRGNVSLQTTNGGMTWSVHSMRILSKYNIDYPWDYPVWLFLFTSICFVDETNGWAVGRSWGGTGMILRTTDGGMTWVEQTGWPLESWQPFMGESVGYGNLLNSVTFLDTNKGWVVGYGGAIFHTVNGGETWVEQTHHATRVCLRSATFYTPIVGFAVGDKGVLVRTTDGKTWNQHNPNIPGWCHYKSIALSGPHLWVVGYGSVDGERAHGRIFHSANVGSTWTEQTSITDAHGNPLNLEEIELLSVVFVDETEGWVAGKSGIILHTTDGGTHWVRQESGVTYIIDSLAFVEANGWAIGLEITGEDEYDGFILHTNDGGIHWTQQESVTTILRDITFIDDKTGWAVGAGTILNTSDSGQNWNVQVSVAPCCLQATAVTFADKHNGWVVTSAGFFHTTDGGENWCREHSGTSNRLWDVVFTNTFAPEVWAVGDYGTILHYSKE